MVFWALSVWRRRRKRVMSESEVMRVMRSFFLRVVFLFFCGFGSGFMLFKVSCKLLI